MTLSRGLFEELATPRLVGSPDHRRVRESLKRELGARGYVVLEHEFSITPPGRLFGPFVAGGLLAWVSLGVLLQALVSSGTAVAGALAVGLAILLIVIVRARGTTVPGVNLIGVRPRARVEVWLTAHYDSKGQPISMLTRIGAVVTALAGAVALLAVAVGALSAAPWPSWLRALLSAPGLIGGGLLLANRATNNSPGAVDNASALATVLAIVDRLPPDAPVGIVFPDAEEYGLIGARALVAQRSNLFRGTTVINFDGIDDRGGTLCAVHRPGPVVDGVVRALGGARRGLLPVVVDGWELARAARECVTIMRGDWRTAAIVHTPRDTVDRVALTGAEQVATRVAQALHRAEPR